MKKLLLWITATGLMAVSCQKQAIAPEGDINQPVEELVSMQDVAKMLSGIGLQHGNMEEVYDAVSSSSGNGYDEEYTMKNLFNSPGAGVGDEKLKAAPSPKSYSKPLREMIEEYYNSATKSGGSISAKEYLDYIKNSDMQIYWPYSENWDGQGYPIITFDPLSEVSVNVGYQMQEDGTVKEVDVTEEMARNRPVWVVNRNDDASCNTLEMIRKNNPGWSQGGSLVIGTKANIPGGDKKLVMKDFTMESHYDCWLAGASEFFVKIGSVNSFQASTEAELKLYNPEITDFMVIVKRDQLGVKRDINTVLVSDWTEQLQSCAFMITEDDGGTITQWNCSAVVKYNSKSYGFEISLPLNSRDDIVWRGSLTRKYIEASNDIRTRFGDVLVTFSVQDL